MSQSADESLAIVADDSVASQRYSEVRSRVVEHLPDLRHFARSMTPNRAQADDLVQEAILRALTAAEQFTPGTNFRAWVFVILRNLLYSQSKRPWVRHIPLHEVDVPDPLTRSSQDNELEYCDFRRAFYQLSSVHRRALILIGVNGMSYQEAAAVSNCAAGTMKSRVSRARRALKSLLSEDQLDLPRHLVEPIAGLDLITTIKDADLPHSVAMLRSFAVKPTHVTA